MLKNLKLLNVYNSKQNDIVNEFYNLTLSNN